MTEFKKFVKDENDNAKKKTFNSKKRIEEFRKLITDLYDKVDNDWLNDEISDGEVKTETIPFKIYEEALGEYEVEKKVIEIGDNRITLQPVGTIILGTPARIDMIYHGKSVMIVYTGENIDYPSQMISISINGEPERKQKDPGKPVWKFAYRDRLLKLVTITADTFQQQIMDLVKSL